VSRDDWGRRPLDRCEPDDRTDDERAEQTAANVAYSRWSNERAARIRAYLKLPPGAMVNLLWGIYPFDV
jgi:hypothetical protein